MIVVMEADAPGAAVERVISYLVAVGCDVHRSSGQTLTILGVVGKVTENDRAVVEEMEGVAQVVRVSEPYKLASRRFRGQGTVIDGDWGNIGGAEPWIAMEPVGLVAPSAPGDRPPASTRLPYEVAAGRPFDAAVVRTRQGPDYVGSLACLSLHAQPIDQKWPVLFLVRQSGWGPEQWVAAAERELARGVTRLVLLESGGQQSGGRRTLEVKAIALTRSLTHLPIVVDVPTISERIRYCPTVAASAVAAGANGVILRAWVGDTSAHPRVPATLPWNRAVALAERLRAMGELLRQ